MSVYGGVYGGVITPATEAARTTGYITCYTAGVRAAGVVIEVQLVKGPGMSALSHSTAIRSAVSDGNGDVQIANMLRNARYRARRGEGGWKYFKTADAATTPLPEVLGHE